jgi:hypothetical protein
VLVALFDAEHAALEGDAFGNGVDEHRDGLRLGRQRRRACRLEVVTDLGVRGWVRRAGGGERRFAVDRAAAEDARGANQEDAEGEEGSGSAHGGLSG